MDTLVVIPTISIIIILGSIGNFMSFIVWKYGKRCQNSSCGSYVWSLALNDLFLLSVLATEFVLLIGGIPIRNKQIAVCKVVLYLGLVTPQVSAWITVAIATERMLYVSFPIRMHQSDVKRRSALVLIIIILLSMTLNVLPLIANDIVTYQTLDSNGSASNYTFRLCTPYESEFAEQYDVILTLSYGVFTFLVPFVLMSASNVVMLIKVYIPGRASVRKIAQRKHLSSITKVVACISVLHCISTLPYALHTNRELLNLPEINVEFPIISYMFNSGFNFVIYCFFSSVFRNDLKEIFFSVCHFRHDIPAAEISRSVQNTHI